MNADIAKIDSVYRQIQDTVDPNPKRMMEIVKFTADEWTEFRKSQPEKQQIYRENVEKLFQILPSLDPQEIADAYQKGSRLLQRNLSGYMADNFHECYLHVMSDSIKDEHFHTASIFLQVLVNKGYQDIEEVVAAALNMPHLHATTLNVIEQLKLSSFVPRVAELIESDNKNVSEHAKIVLKAIKS